MRDEDMTRDQLLAELAGLRRQVALLEGVAQKSLAELANVSAQLQHEVEDHRRVEEALRQSEKKYRRLIEACPDAVMMVDPQARVIFASVQAVQLYGADSEAELCGRPILSLIAEEERARAIAAISDLMSEGVRRRNEYKLLLKSGKTFPGEISSSVVRSDSGELLGIISIVRDISAQKEAQAALRREHQTLNHLLQSSDHERQIIAYEIHDGLAQQLAGAIMQFQVYEHSKANHSKAAASAFRAGMALLQQSHFEARRLISGVRPPILDEEGIVAATAHLVNEERRKNGPKIEFHADVEFDRLAPILENAVYRIIQEALANASRHSQAEHIDVRLMQSGDLIRIEVSDQGVGFRPEEVGESRFGLAGIRERARLLGGEASVETALHEGTRVVVELPLVLRSTEGDV
jgi:two-component system sensor kinase